MTASQPTLLKIMVQPIARPGRVHICQHAQHSCLFIFNNIFKYPHTCYTQSYIEDWQ